MTELIWITPDAEATMAYCARVSSSNQDNPDLRLLHYCAEHGHWSVFEMASMCVEIVTSRAISAQIIRHRSFSFQEHSQRYATAMPIEARVQAENNRQSSAEGADYLDQRWWEERQAEVFKLSTNAYAEALVRGIAREQARMVLPLATQTRLYMSGTIRSWIHYLQLRTAEDAQKEHREAADSVAEIFRQELPTVAEAVGL